mgnify:CR=1 FL=1
MVDKIGSEVFRKRKGLLPTKVVAKSGIPLPPFDVRLKMKWENERKQKLSDEEFRELLKKELLSWAERYNKEEGTTYDLKTEKEIGDRLRFKLELSKEDLKEIVRWKFQENRLKGRRLKVLRMLENVDDTLIKNISRKALTAQSDYERIHLLRTIHGVGLALASVILTFYDPKNYGVFDTHVWRELFGKEPKGLFNNPAYLFRVLLELRRIAKNVGLDVRTVEKALFKRNLELQTEKFL